MSVIVKGMKMPTSCSDCLFFVDGFRDVNDEPCSVCLAMEDNFPWSCGYKEIDGIDHTTGRMHYCPLAGLPEKHGRLIDADFVIEKAYHEAKAMNEPFESNFGFLVEWIVDKTPTAVEAEGNND